MRLTHGNQIHAAWSFAQVHGLDENDVVINGFPLFHVGGTLTAGLSVVAAGGHVIYPSPYGLRDKEALRSYWKTVEAFGVTIVCGVPTSIAALADIPDGGFRHLLRPDGADRRRRLPQGRERALSRPNGDQALRDLRDDRDGGGDRLQSGARDATAGKRGVQAPFAQTQIVSLEPGHRETICPPGTSGLVMVKGPQVFPGYLDPRHDEAVRRGDGWLVTGDVGYLTDDQRLVLTGREKDLIVRSGHNINPADIEDVANAFPGVQISAAVGMPDGYAGEVPILFAVPVPGTVLDAARLQRHLDDHVGEPPARPKRIIVIDALPMTAVGKILKGKLRDRAVVEKVRTEVERIFGTSVIPRIAVSKDDKLNTVVLIEIGTNDARRLQKLRDALDPLPQRYVVLAAPGEGGSSPVTLERIGAVAVITLNRPAALNAMSEEVVGGLDRVLEKLATDVTVRAAIVTGAGKAFSAGGDLREFGEKLEKDPMSLLATLALNQRHPEQAGAAAVSRHRGGQRGRCRRWAGARSVLRCRRGIGPGDDGRWPCEICDRAGRRILGSPVHQDGRQPGLTPALQRRSFPAAKLMEWGLVNEVVPAGRLLERAREIANHYSRQSPEVLRHMKSLAHASVASRIEIGLRLELRAFRAHLESRDLAEGLKAFREKRKPNY